MAPPETKDPPVMAVTEGPESSTGKGLNGKDSTRSVDDYARERYRLDGQIKRILRADAKKRAPEKFPGDVYRTIDCTWCRVADLSMVRPADRDSYHYKGLATCGSLHTCPICASKIQERRRQEVEQAIAWAAVQERAGYVVSLTFPHRIDQPLKDLLKMQRDALAHMRNSRGYKQLMERCKHAGRIRSLEVTHGQNGWHPHTHELLFLDPEVPAEWLKWQLVWLWLKSCRKVGLFRDDRDNEEDFCRYSVDVRAGDEGTADYLAKMDDQRTWGLSHELTKSSSKQGRRAGSHPFKLASEPATHGLFLEYVQAMKGSRQLVWSRGLKDAVGVSDKSDEEIAQEEVAKVSDQIPVADRAWRFVLGNDARWELTHAAKTGGRSAVDEFLTLLGYEETAMPTFEESTNPLPDAGEVMLLTFHQDRNRWRPVIYVGPPEEPNKASQLYLGEWRNSLRKAQVSGLKVYFERYLERYGFRHPEDPMRCGDRTPLPYNVVSLRSDQGDAQSYTCDEWPEGRQAGVH